MKLLGNVWDVTSARAAEKEGYELLGTSSGAIANMLGYEDGEFISFEELYYIVARIKKSTTVPLSIDMEAGYGVDAATIIENIEKLASIGVIGINIEDSVVKDRRVMKSADDFAALLGQVTKSLGEKNLSVFVNVRTDAYLLGYENALEESISRGKKYREAGADGLFVPYLKDLKEMRQVISETELPLNIMCSQEMPELSQLEKIGVGRVSMGVSVFKDMEKHVHGQFRSIKAGQSFQTIFAS